MINSKLHEEFYYKTILYSKNCKYSNYIIYLIL